MEDAGRPSRERRRVTARRDAVARRLGDRQPYRRLADEPAEQPDRVRAAADAREGEVGQPALGGLELDRGLVADPALEVAHDRRVRVRAHRRPEHVVGGLDVGHPVTHRLVDRVLERCAAASDRADLGTQRVHPEHVRLLPLDVLRAHVHDARQPEQRARGGGRDAVLAGARLRDDPCLAEPPREQRLAERVIDLVRAGMGEVLALQVQAKGRGRLAAGRGLAGAIQDPLGEPICAIERRRATGEGREQLAQLGPEARVVAELVVRSLQLGECAHERLGHVPAAELAGRRPIARWHPLRGGPGRPGLAGSRGSGGQSEPRGLVSRRARHGAGPCAAARPGTRGASVPDATSTPTAADIAERAGDVGRIQAAGEDDRYLASDRRQRALGPPECPCRPGVARRRCRGGCVWHQRPGRRPRRSAR